jgi:hypothetical protein
MEKSINLIFKKRPAMSTTVFLAFWGSSRKFAAGKPLPQITAEQKGVTVDQTQLEEFRNICEMAQSDKLPLIYPFTLIYPLIQRILAQKAAPLSLFKVLNSRMQVWQHRKIAIAETLDIFCAIAGIRIREKGLEIDIASVIKSAGMPVWESTQTFYYRGIFGTPDKNYLPPQFKPIPDAAQTGQWFLQGGIGRRFSRISGDSNPIHYWKTYARLMGFRRDFAQPLLVLGSALKYLFPADDENSVTLDIALKAPVYYESYIILKSEQDNDGRRFDIYLEGDSLPCICGKLQSTVGKAIPTKQE